MRPLPPLAALGLVVAALGLGACVAPAKIHGWWRLSDLSRPGLRMILGIGVCLAGLTRDYHAVTR